MPGNIDARSKIVIVLCLSTLAVLIQNIIYLSFIIILSLIISVFMKGNIGKVYRILGKIWYLFVIIVLVQSIFTRTGRELVSIGDITLLTTTGLNKGAEFILRLLIIISSATILATSNSREVVQGLHQWKVPYEVVFMVSTGIRFLPLLTEEVKDTIIAIQLRGIEINRLSLKRRMKLYYYIFMPIVAGAIRKARDLSIAMETRAFRAFNTRTSYLVLKLKVVDYLIILLSISATISLLIIYYIFV